MNKIETIKLGEIAEFRNGLNFAKENSIGTGCKMLGVADFKNNIFPKYEELEEINPIDIVKDDDYLKFEDIVFVRSNGNKDLVGRSIYINKDTKLTYSGFCIRLRLNNTKINSLFLYYYTKSKSFKNSISTSSGTNIQNLNQKILADVDIPLFNQKIQNKITNIIYSIDLKIELNNKINKELNTMAKTLYDYWFVQFDFPNTDGKPYKSSGGKMIYNQKLKSEIPEECEVKNISELLNVVTGREDANFAVENGKYPFFTCSGNVSSCDEYAFEGKAILIAGNGNFNVKLYEGKFNAYQRTYVLIPNDEKFYSVIFYAVKDQLKKLSNSSAGSIIKFITKGDVDNISLVLPTFGNDKIFDKLNDITALIEKNIEQNKELAKLKDWLLPMLMNGQVRVNLED